MKILLGQQIQPIIAERAHAQPSVRTSSVVHLLLPGRPLSRHQHPLTSPFLLLRVTCDIIMAPFAVSKERNGALWLAVYEELKSLDRYLGLVCMNT